MKKILILAGLVAAGYFGVKDSNLPFFKNYISDTISPVASPECKIKGNISINSGRKIYHVLGQKDYENTRIQPEHGERWFCTEEEAINAGWRKAPR